MGAGGGEGEASACEAPEVLLAAMRAGWRLRGPRGPLGGHEGAGEALGEPHEEEPQVEGHQTQQR
jgi:hypothetical protein